MRVWLYDLLRNEPDLYNVLSDRFFPRQRLTTAHQTFPYLAYSLGNSTSMALADAGSDEMDAETQFFTIYLYDTPGDYLRIDGLIPTVKRLLVGASSPDDGVIAVRWLETSGEQDDQTFRAIFRYVRFQAVRRQE